MESVDYYTVLGIASTADQNAIKAAYKRLALLYHPDRCDHPQATEQMQLLNQAYEVLRSPEKRADYDQAREITRPLATVEVAQEPEPQRTTVSNSTRYPDENLNGWLHEQFRKMSLLVPLTLLLFLFSVFTGQVNIVFILIPVLLAIYIIVSIIMRIRYQIS